MPRRRPSRFRSDQKGLPPKITAEQWSDALSLPLRPGNRPHAHAAAEDADDPHRLSRCGDRVIRAPPEPVPRIPGSTAKLVELRGHPSGVLTETGLVMRSRDGRGYSTFLKPSGRGRDTDALCRSQRRALRQNRHKAADDHELPLEGTVVVVRVEPKIPSIRIVPHSGEHVLQKALNRTQRNLDPNPDEPAASLIHLLPHTAVRWHPLNGTQPGPQSSNVSLQLIGVRQSRTGERCPWQLPRTLRRPDVSGACRSRPQYAHLHDTTARAGGRCRPAIAAAARLQR